MTMERKVLHNGTISEYKILEKMSHIDLT